MDLILILLALGVGLGTALDSGALRSPPDEAPAAVAPLPELPEPEPGTGTGIAQSPPGPPRETATPEIVTEAPDADRPVGAFTPLPAPAPGGGTPKSIARAPGTDAPAGSFVPLPEIPAPQDLAPENLALDSVQGFAAEDQTPTGRFTTAAEIRQILSATKGSWIALRDYGGQDLLYFTQLLSWRCGLHQIRYSVNGGPAEVFPAEPCYDDTATPNAIKAETVQPYIALPAGSVDRVDIDLLYDDLTTDSGSFARAAILMP